MSLLVEARKLRLEIGESAMVIGQGILGLFAGQIARLRLPADLFPVFHEAQRLVHRYGHIEVDRAHYSVPPE